MKSLRSPFFGSRCSKVCGCNAVSTCVLPYDAVSTCVFVPFPLYNALLLCVHLTLWAKYLKTAILVNYFLNSAIKGQNPKNDRNPFLPYTKPIEETSEIEGSIDDFSGIMSAIYGDYEVRSKLGGGQLSTVWKAKHRISGQVVALKQINLSKLNPHLKKCLDCEITFLSSVNHHHIVRLFDVFQIGDCIFLVFEFCGGGNLASYIHQHSVVEELTAKRFMQQLGCALKVLNSHHIIHRDLKPENILLSSTESDAPVVKVADFGLSRILHPNDFANTVCGSPLYMAPEVLEFQRYGEKVDMWSVGAILFELLNGHPPFHGRSNVQVLQNIKACKYLPFSDIIHSRMHPDCLDLCSRLLCTNPENRLSFDEFYRHDFIRTNKP